MVYGGFDPRFDVQAEARRLEMREADRDPKRRAEEDRRRYERSRTDGADQRGGFLRLLTLPFRLLVGRKPSPRKR